jgi:hypothetical protein
MDCVRRLLLLTFLSLAFSLGWSKTMYSQESAACAGCSLVQDALKASDAVKPGMSRKDVEAQFESDGGMQTGAWGRYVFRRCRTIKIDVRFTGADEGTGAAMLPTDKVLGASRPYLEIPFAD